MFPFGYDPLLSEECHEFYAKYNRLYPGSWSAVSWMHSCKLSWWKEAVEIAGTTDPTAVLKALKAMPDVFHYFGRGTWGLESLYGVDNVLTVPWPVVEIRDGKPLIVAQTDFLDWYNKHGDILIRHLEGAGCMWYQR